MAFDLTNTLWNYNQENFQNVNVHKSLPNAPTNQAFNIPMGNSGKTYQAPVVYPQSEMPNAIFRHQPVYDTTLDPALAHENILNQQKLVGQDPRTNITGENVDFAKRIANMDIQINKMSIYPILGIAGIFLGAILIARMVK